MSALLAVIGAFAIVAGIGGLIGVAATQRTIIRRSAPGRIGPATVRRRLNSKLLETDFGKKLQALLSQGTWSRLLPIDAVALSLALGVVVWLVTRNLLSGRLAPIFAIGVPFAIWIILRRQRARRHERFVSQMPQLARILSNATSAGLSLRTAIDIAADEMPNPVGEEMQQVHRSLTYGESTAEALTSLRDRMPSREIDVLVSTLIVSSRAGGSLVSSLRRIAETLEERKQTRREILSMLAEARSTLFLIPAIGLGSLFMVRTVDPTAIDRMLTDTVGQLIFAGAGISYAIGGFLFYRVTKVEA